MIKKLPIHHEPKDDPDHHLVELVRGGDEDAFKELIRRHREKIRNLVFLTMGPEIQADDLVQEVFTKVYFKLNKFRFESKFTTWLFRLTVNHCKDALRRRKIRRIFTVFEKHHEDSISVDPSSAAELQEIMQKALALLPDNLRIPLVLRELEGFSYKEIADITGQEMGTVKSRIFRARENLKEILMPLKNQISL